MAVWLSPRSVKDSEPAQFEGRAEPARVMRYDRKDDSLMEIEMEYTAKQKEQARSSYHNGGITSRYTIKEKWTTVRAP